jgi:conjugative transposon TraM protein
MSTNCQTTAENKPRLSNEQKQKMKKYAVFTLMGVICAGCIFLIFSPSADGKSKQEQQIGFNTDIPMPKNETIIGDKRDAYEQEQMKQKQSERMRSLEDFSAMLGSKPQKPSDDLILLDDEPQAQKTPSGGASQNRPQSSIQNSAKACRDINRTLGNFYEKPKEDAEKDELKKQVVELKARMDEAENRKSTVNEQMALMEKSFQMASQYLPMGYATTSAAPASSLEPQTASATSGTKVSGKTAVVPVSQVVEQTVSALPQEVSGKDRFQAFDKPRNRGFLTATASMSQERKNTISACVHADQTIMDGERVCLRLLEPMWAGSMLIRENAVLSGFSKIQGERLQIDIYSLEYSGNIIPVEIAVFDTDGQRGIFIPDTKAINAAKEIAANMGTNAGTGISLSSDAGEQFAADMGRSVIQGVSQFFSKKMCEVKVNLKAGYRVFLLPEGNINNSPLASK